VVVLQAILRRVGGPAAVPPAWTGSGAVEILMRAVATGDLTGGASAGTVPAQLPPD